MTGEQVIEAFMTNALVRGLEILVAPIWIWWKSHKKKKEWPTPILVGFVIVVLASCILLEEKITGWARLLSYGDEQIIRDWLDEQKLPNTMSSTKEDAFVFDVEGSFKFKIFRRFDRPGVVHIRSILVFNPDIEERLAKITPEQRRELWNELRVELSRHSIYLPSGEGKDFKDLSRIDMQKNFAFPPGTSKAVLYQQLSDMKGMKYVIDLMYELWKSQKKM
jgi:hypothetical protein